MLSDFVTSCVAKVARNEGFVEKNYKVVTTPGSQIGDNFLSVMTAITLTGMRELNGIRNKDVLHLVCKATPLNEVRNKKFKSALIFEREIYIYSKLLPAFVRFQQENGLNGSDSFLAFPRVYFCEMNEENDTSILIMEDLRSKNFLMWPKDKLPISLDHELLVLRELAKFHAISFAMKDQRPHIFHDFEQLKDISYELMINGPLTEVYGKLMDRAIQALDDVKHKNLMRSFRKTFVRRMEHLLLDPSAEPAVILHADFWNNNFLFQYSGDNRNGLKGINFVDWQLSHFRSPAIDVLYNIFTSTDKEFRDQHHETLLSTYYGTLSETIRKLGSNPDELYSFEQFQRQLKEFGEYMLLYAPIMFTLRLAEAKDFMDLDDYCERLEKGEDVVITYPFEGETQKKYHKLVNDNVIDLLRYGYVEVPNDNNI